MIQTLLAYLLFALVIVSAYPWAAWLLRRGSETRLSAAVVALALSLGTLTLVMLWEGMLGVPFSTLGITLPYLLLMLPGAFLWWRERNMQARHPSPPINTNGVRAGLRPTPTETDDEVSSTSTLLRHLPVLILIAISAAILFNAVYWPFHRDDVLGIYAPHARTMYELRGLVPLTGADSLYRTYPMLIPSVYTYAYLASGWENEYLANLTGALLSVGCLPVIYWLGCLLKDARTGWLSAVLLAVTPAFGRWGSAGYVDLPMAFFYGLSAVFAIRLWRSGHWQDALLAGVMMGLAAWTKNAALIGVLLLGVWLLWALLNRRLRWMTALLALVCCAVVALPWYARNLLDAGFLVPATAWTDQAQRTLANLFVFITKFDNFGVSGWVAMGGVIAALIIILRRRLHAPEHLLLLLWALPFFAAWWLFVSYDPRFLLLFMLPLWTLGASLVVDVWKRIPAVWQPRLRIAAVLLIIALTAQALWFSVEYKDEMLRDPFMDDAAKHAIVGRE